MILSAVSVARTQLSEYVNVSANLKFVPSDIPTDTQQVKLSDNLIADVPSDIFVNHDQLWYLNFSKNELVEFPNLTSIADTLDTLDLMDNQIETINSNFLNSLSQIKNLNLKNNTLGRIPVLTSDLENLRILVQQNCLLNTPPVIENPSNLIELHIGKNLFTTIPDDYFLEMLSLKILWINELGVSEFIKLNEETVMKDLYAHNTLITSVSQQTLHHMTHLRKLAFFRVCCFLNAV